MEAEATILTSEQENIIKNIQDGKNITVVAIPGAGKTSTIRFACERLEKTKQIIILTYNRHIREEVNYKLKDYENVEVFTFHSYATRIFETMINNDYELYKALDENKEISTSFDILFVDEAQDMTEEFVKLILFAIRNNTKGKCQLIFLGDPRQNIYAFSGSSTKFILEPEKYFPGFEFMNLTLSKSFRLTHKMTDFINRNFNKDKKFVDIVPKDFDDCKSVKIYDYTKKTEISDVIKMSVEKYGIENVAVLLPSINKQLAKILVNQLSFDNLYLHVSENSDEVNREFLINKLSFSTFHRNKGMEKKCVIVTNFDEDYYNYYNRAGSFNNNALFVAITRASEELILFKNKYANPLPDLCMITMKEQLNSETVVSGCENWVVKKDRINFSNDYTPVYPVTDLIKFMSVDFIKIVLDKITVNTETFKSVRVKRIQTFGKIKEDVSYLYGCSVSIIFEYLTGGKITKMEAIEKDILDNKVPKELYFQRGPVKKLAQKAMKDYKKCFLNMDDKEENLIKYRKELFFIINLIHCWFNSFHLIHQIKNYNWVSEEFIKYIIEQSHELVSEGTDYELYFYKEYKVEKLHMTDEMMHEKEQVVGVKGFVDAIKENTLYEFKYCAKDSLDHVIQSVCYSNICDREIKEIKIVNFFTGTIRTINFNECENFLQALVNNKFN
jgi:hypothetical protein